MGFVGESRVLQRIDGHLEISFMAIKEKDRMTTVAQDWEIMHVDEFPLMLHYDLQAPNNCRLEQWEVLMFALSYVPS